MWQALGRHQVRLVEDVLESRWAGAATLDEIDRFLALASELFRRHPQGFLLIDSTHATAGTPELRRRIFEWTKTNSVRGGIVMYGASGAARVLGILMVRAITLLKGGDADQRIAFLSDAAEAQSWIARRRQQLAARPKP